MKKIISLLFALMFFAVSASAQRLALSTNALTWADGATLNMDVALSLHRHWTVDAGVKYNPYADVHKERSFMVGGRFWPWYTYSGWWLSARAKYQEYNDSSSLRTEGDRVGGSVAAGYSAMLGKHLNLDMGFAMWSGYDTYRSYRCSTCGRIVGSGGQYFLLPDEIIMALTYIF